MKTGGKNVAINIKQMLNGASKVYWISDWNICVTSSAYEINE